MEVLIIVLPVALLGIAALALLWLLSQRRPAAEAESQRQEQRAQRLEQQLAAMKSDLAQSMTQAVGASQHTVLQQVNSVDQKLNTRFDGVQNTMDQRLANMQTNIDQRLEGVGRSMTGTQETMRNVDERLGELAQSTQQVLQVGRDISSLQDILRPPKLRGGFGELLLERLLAEVVPNHYTTQHKFRRGTVDAVINLGNGMVTVDSKFPLESFHRMQSAASDEERATFRREFVRAVRGHIDDVAKYILPDEGTLPFALMYIPAENVYYEVIVKDDMGDAQANLCSYAMERRVVPVSPNSFYAYLQAILLGLRGLQVEERAYEIIRHLERLNGDFASMRDDMRKVGNHLKDAYNRYGDVDRSFTSFGDRLAAATDRPVQAPLPDPAIAPAPLGEPLLTNGGDP